LPIRHHIMNRLVALVLALASFASAQDFEEKAFSGPSFQFTCPEKNGLFADKEQCDLYYVCIDSKAEAKLCEDGYLFDDSVINREKCVLPHGVDCGDREFVQARAEGIDERCDRANGFFNHEDPQVCDKFYQCDNGTAHEMPCAFPLIFDVAIGACVRSEQASPEARQCNGDGFDDESQLKVVDGFRCPGKEVIGPTGLLQAHPIFPHPSDCQFFFTCFFGKDPNKFGCTKGEVFDADSQVCKSPEEVRDCACWYDCGEKSECPDSCNADCSCPSGNVVIQE